MGKNHCTVDLLFDRLGLVCFANKTKIVSCHTADSKPVKQEVIGTVILTPLVFPVETNLLYLLYGWVNWYTCIGNYIEGMQKLTGENLKTVRAEFSTLSQAVYV
jgi:hypothetical protein